MCELLAERIKLIQMTKKCPPDLLSCISTVIWACDRVDIPELVLIRKQFRAKYGKDFEERALNNVGGVLNERVVSRLSIQPPAAYLVQTYLEDICEKYEVSWKPKVPVAASEMAEPMAAPVGYSVQVHGPSGMDDVTTGQAHTDSEVSYQRPPKDDDDTRGGGGDDGGLAIPPPAVVATPYVPPPVTAPAESRDDFQEVDIYVPAVPIAPVGGPKKDDGSDTGTGSASNGGTGSDYADLAARFDKLSK